jgi:fatty-acyl-CoA synthase
MLRTSDASRDGTAQNPWNGRTVADMLDASVRAHGSSPAVVDGDRVIGFAELAALRDGLASTLSERDIGDGTHVAVFMAKSWEYAVLLHALWSLGAVVVPLNTMWQAEEVGRALTDSDAEVLVAGRSAAGRPIGTVVDDLALPWASAVADARFPALRQVIGDGPDSGSGVPALHLRSLIDAGFGRTAPRASRQETLILFSSGSTDRPKGVVLRQDGLLGTAHYFFEALGVGAQDRFVSLGPYFHAGGIVQLLGCNQTGAAHYLFDGVDVPRIVDVAVREECTALTGFDPVLSSTSSTAVACALASRRSGAPRGPTATSGSSASVSDRR